MTNKQEQIVELLNMYMRKMSYYNAAEGGYGREAKVREAAKTVLKAIVQEALAHEIDKNYITDLSRGYLVSSTDLGV